MNSFIFKLPINFSSIIVLDHILLWYFLINSSEISIKYFLLLTSYLTYRCNLGNSFILALLLIVLLSAYFFILPPLTILRLMIKVSKPFMIKFLFNLFWKHFQSILRPFEIIVSIFFQQVAYFFIHVIIVSYFSFSICFTNIIFSSDGLITLYSKISMFSRLL